MHETINILRPITKVFEILSHVVIGLAWICLKISLKNGKKTVTIIDTLN
jgi:hypothetical protein